MYKILDIIKPGVIFGKDIKKIFSIAKKNNFAIPAINCINTDSINAVLETAKKMRSPVIIQFSYGGSSFFIGKGIDSKENIKNAILGSTLAAKYVHSIAKYYKIPVILHTDHCHKEILPWIDGLMIENNKFIKKTGNPLFSSHMIDLSQEKIENNIILCKKYFKKLDSMNIFLEIELGCTGGEEDGINNSNLKKEYLYTTPQDVHYAYKELSDISSNFTIAASFGNVHGVYKKGSIDLKPIILKKSQEYVKKNNSNINQPIDFVFHGSSGTDIQEIQKSISYGVVKINIDTDIQWASWNGILNFYNEYKNYLQNQLGNPEGSNKPNKKYYDPRTWIRKSQEYIVKRLEKSFKDFNSYNVL
ncbi:class II fructose-bisphosphate aldolase [Buchnera aphidicola (Kurisakia onigurumii)]|uniref:class II fructose-bisphosphate aldolase n=1 Tax=Buchnera aphidicola TaxID=9 RepID=UPI0031B7067C